MLRALDKNNVYLSAGLSAKYTEKSGSTLCTIEMLTWADKVFVFESEHIKRIQKYAGDDFLSKVVNLNIEDEFYYFQRELVLKLLEIIQDLDISD